PTSSLSRATATSNGSRAISRTTKPTRCGDWGPIRPSRTASSTRSSAGRFLLLPSEGLGIVRGEPADDRDDHRDLPHQEQDEIRTVVAESEEPDRSPGKGCVPPGPGPGAEAPDALTADRQAENRKRSAHRAAGETAHIGRDAGIAVIVLEKGQGAENRLLIIRYGIDRHHRGVHCGDPSDRRQGDDQRQL